MTARSFEASIALLFLLQACGHVEKKAAAPETAVEETIVPQAPTTEPKEKESEFELPKPEIKAFKDGQLQWTWASKENVRFYVFVSLESDKKTFDVAESVGNTAKNEIRIRIERQGDRSVYLYVVAVDESGRQSASAPFELRTPPIAKPKPEPRKPSPAPTPERTERPAEEPPPRREICSPVTYLDDDFRSFAPDGVDDFRERNLVEEGIFRLACPLMFDRLTELGDAAIPELQTEVAEKYRSFGLNTNHVTRLMSEMRSFHDVLEKGSSPKDDDPCWKNFQIEDASLKEGESLYSRMAERGIHRFIVVYPAKFYGAEQASYACAGIWKRACAGTTVEFAKNNSRYAKLTTCDVVEDGGVPTAILRWKGRGRPRAP